MKDLNELLKAAQDKKTTLKRQLLKSKAQSVVYVIRGIVSQVSHEYAEFTKPPHVGHSQDSRTYGMQLNGVYESEVHQIALNLVYLILDELGLQNDSEQTAKIIPMFFPSSGDETIAGNKPRIESIAQYLEELSSQL
jgi:hypothetical protein